MSANLELFDEVTSLIHRLNGLKKQSEAQDRCIAQCKAVEPLSLPNANSESSESTAAAGDISVDNDLVVGGNGSDNCDGNDTNVPLTSPSLMRTVSAPAGKTGIPSPKKEAWKALLEQSTYRFEWDNNGTWCHYSDDVEDSLSAGYRAFLSGGPSSISVSIFSVPYTVDFLSLQQVNTNTGFRRAILVSLEGAAPPKATSAFFSSFSPDDTSASSSVSVNGAGDSKLTDWDAITFIPAAEEAFKCPRGECTDPEKSYCTTQCLAQQLSDRITLIKEAKTAAETKEEELVEEGQARLGTLATDFEEALRKTAHSHQLRASARLKGKRRCIEAMGRLFQGKFIQIEGGVFNALNGSANSSAGGWGGSSYGYGNPNSYRDTYVPPPLARHRSKPRGGRGVGEIAMGEATHIDAFIKNRSRARFVSKPVESNSSNGSARHFRMDAAAKQWMAGVEARTTVAADVVLPIFGHLTLEEAVRVIDISGGQPDAAISLLMDDGASSLYNMLRVGGRGSHLPAVVPIPEGQQHLVTKACTSYVVARIEHLDGATATLLPVLDRNRIPLDTEQARSVEVDIEALLSCTGCRILSDLEVDQVQRDRRDRIVDIVFQHFGVEEWCPISVSPAINLNKYITDYNPDTKTLDRVSHETDGEVLVRAVLDDGFGLWESSTPIDIYTQKLDDETHSVVHLHLNDIRDDVTIENVNITGTDLTVDDCKAFEKDASGRALTYKLVVKDAKVVAVLYVVGNDVKVAKFREIMIPASGTLVTLPYSQIGYVEAVPDGMVIRTEASAKRDEEEKEAHVLQSTPHPLCFCTRKHPVELDGLVDVRIIARDDKVCVLVLVLLSCGLFQLHY